MTKKIKEIIVSVVMLGLFGFVIYLTTSGKDNIKDKTKEIFDLGNQNEEVSADFFAENEISEDEMMQHLSNGDCMCEYWASRYMNYEREGYLISPTMDYDTNNKNLSYEASGYRYGIPKVRGIFDEEYLYATQKYREKLKDSLPTSIVVTYKNCGIWTYALKSSVIKIGQRVCLPEELCDIEIKDLKIYEDLSQLDKKGIVKTNWDIHKRLFNEDGTFRNDFKKDYKVAVVDINLYGNSPWVEYIDTSAWRLESFEEKSEYFEMMDKSLAGTGEPLYQMSLTDNEDFEGTRYPISAGEVVTLRIAYIIFADSTDDYLYIVSGGGDLFSYNYLFKVD